LGLNGAEDIRDVPAGDTTKDVGGGKTGVIQKVRNVVVGNIEIAEAVKQIRSATWPRAICNVELRLAAYSDWTANLRVETR